MTQFLKMTLEIIIMVSSLVFFFHSFHLGIKIVNITFKIPENSELQNHNTVHKLYFLPHVSDCQF